MKVKLDFAWYAKKKLQSSELQKEHSLVLSITALPQRVYSLLLQQAGLLHRMLQRKVRVRNKGHRL